MFWTRNPPFLSALACAALSACFVDSGGSGAPQPDFFDAGATVGSEPPSGSADTGVKSPAQSAGQDAGDTLDAAAPTDDGATSNGGEPDAAPSSDPPDATPSADAADVPTDDAGPAHDASPAHDAAADASEPIDASDAGTGGPQGCSLKGSFSAAADFDVEWEGTKVADLVPVVAPGQGTIRIVTRVDVADEGGAVQRAQLKACLGWQPDFAGSWLVGETYSAYIPNKAWDAPTMPLTDMLWRVGCATQGCALNADPISPTFGARHAPGDMWPGRTGPISQIVPLDHDNDALPGITLLTRGSDEETPDGMPYSQPPVSWNLGSNGLRAVTLQLALQVRATVRATLTNCDAFSGSIEMGAVEARALGCYAQKVDKSGSPRPCNTDQVSFVDDNLPRWTFKRGRFRALRVDEGASCSEVRAVWD